jgi:hypothetical protein
MSQKHYRVSNPADAAIHVIAALIAAGKVGVCADEIAKAHQEIAKALAEHRPIGCNDA